ncbi:immunoglobulin iota chain-like, partial [Sinocyclocheilus rhinocerous]|uniref:immunoglobulin iota chain-like n=1 Tax=Sinocyclocheilus rhinocerous TaxID=307959 RepID=UPI0007B94E6E
MDLHSVILFCASAAAVFGNVIKPNNTDVVYEEGSNVILSCSHSSAATDYIHWYRQYGRSKPEFLVLTYGSAKEAEMSDVDPRFSVKVEKREKIHVDLKISSAAVSDSALYYCAL